MRTEREARKESRRRERRSSKRRRRRSTEKETAEPAGCLVDLKVHKFIEARGRRETQGEQISSIKEVREPEKAENIRKRASAGGENFKIVELQQLKFRKGKN